MKNSYLETISSNLEDEREDYILCGCDDERETYLCNLFKLLYADEFKKKFNIVKIDECQLCGHGIKHNYYILNPKKNKLLIVGSHCQRLFRIDDEKIKKCICCEETFKYTDKNIKLDLDNKILKGLLCSNCLEKKFKSGKYENRRYIEVLNEDSDYCLFILKNDNIKSFDMIDFKRFLKKIIKKISIFK